MSLYEHRKEIKEIIDRGEWKHSWHLPKKNGYIDWFSDVTKREVRGLIIRENHDAHELLRETNDLLKKIEEG